MIAVPENDVPVSYHYQTCAKFTVILHSYVMYEALIITMVITTPVAQRVRRGKYKESARKHGSRLNIGPFFHQRQRQETENECQNKNREDCKQRPVADYTVDGLRKAPRATVAAATATTITRAETDTKCELAKSKKSFEPPDFRDLRRDEALTRCDLRIGLPPHQADQLGVMRQG